MKTKNYKSIATLLAASVATVFAFSGCTPSASSLQKVVEDHPEILFNAIEKHPEKFMEVVQKAAGRAQQKSQEEQAKEETRGVFSPKAVK